MPLLHKMRKGGITVKMISFSAVISASGKGAQWQQGQSVLRSCIVVSLCAALMISLSTQWEQAFALLHQHLPKLTPYPVLIAVADGFPKIILNARTGPNWLQAGARAPGPPEGPQPLCDFLSGLYSDSDTELKRTKTPTDILKAL